MPMDTPNQDPNHPTLARVAFQVQNDDYSQDSRFDFAINPQQINEQVAARTSYLNTKDWGTVQNFGTGQRTISISGTTGWRRGLGVQDAWSLKSFLDNYMSHFPLDSADSRKWLWFLNYTDDYAYQVELTPNGYQFSQDVSQPLLVRYNIEMMVMGDQNQANASDRTSTAIGKPGEGGITNGNVGANTAYNATGQAIANLKRDGR